MSLVSSEKKPGCGQLCNRLCIVRRFAILAKPQPTGLAVRLAHAHTSRGVPNATHTQPVVAGQPGFTRSHTHTGLVHACARAAQGNSGKSDVFGSVTFLGTWKSDVFGHRSHCNAAKLLGTVAAEFPARRRSAATSSHRQDHAMTTLHCPRTTTTPTTTPWMMLHYVYAEDLITALAMDVDGDVYYADGFHIDMAHTPAMFVTWPARAYATVVALGHPYGSQNWPALADALRRAWTQDLMTHAVGFGHESPQRYAAEVIAECLSP